MTDLAIPPHRETEEPPGTARSWRTLRAVNEARCAALLARSRTLPVADLDWAAVPRVPLAPPVLSCLVYMRDVEGFTDRYLDGFAAHRTTLADPLVARFLDVWRREERGHALALARFLDHYAQRREVDVPPPQPPPEAAAGTVERLLARVGGPVGRVAAVAHMTWGAANELLTLNGYRLLARRCGHPVLAELLRRIAADESRHFSFYLLQAQWRLAASPLARAVVRAVLARAWTPVGVGEGFKSPAEFAAVASYLAAGPEGRAVVDRMDRRLGSLPGLGGLTVFSDAVRRAGSPDARPRATPPQPAQRQRSSKRHRPAARAASRTASTSSAVGRRSMSA